MFDRFTDTARKAISLARREAERFNHDYIGTEHMLLGLAKEGSITSDWKPPFLDRAAEEVEKLMTRAPEVVTMGQLPFSPRAKKVLEYSIEEARTLDHNYIGPEHLLIGLLREQEGLAAQALARTGPGIWDAREAAKTCRAKLHADAPKEDAKRGTTFKDLNSGTFFRPATCGGVYVKFPSISIVSNAMEVMYGPSMSGVAYGMFNGSAYFRDDIEVEVVKASIMLEVKSSNG